MTVLSHAAQSQQSAAASEMHLLNDDDEGYTCNHYTDNTTQMQAAEKPIAECQAHCISQAIPQNDIRHGQPRDTQTLLSMIIDNISFRDNCASVKMNSNAS